jgi:hypothetical protein
MCPCKVSNAPSISVHQYELLVISKVIYLGKRFCTTGAAVEFSNNVNSLQRIKMAEGLYTFWSSGGIFHQYELFNRVARLLYGKRLFTQQKAFSLVLTPKYGL